jgi:hypothetical protein
MPPSRVGMAQCRPELPGLSLFDRLDLDHLDLVCVAYRCRRKNSKQREHGIDFINHPYLLQSQNHARQCTTGKAPASGGFLYRHISLCFYVIFLFHFS